VYEKTYSKETKEYSRSLNIGKTFSPETKKLLSNINSVPKRKSIAERSFQKIHKTMIRPNISEKIIGKILEGIGIKFKFRQDIDYKTIENKQSSKKIDIV
jgi:hypothetical protein